MAGKADGEPVLRLGARLGAWQAGCRRGAVLVQGEAHLEEARPSLGEGAAAGVRDRAAFDAVGERCGEKVAAILALRIDGDGFRAVMQGDFADDVHFDPREVAEVGRSGRPLMRSDRCR